MLRQTFVIIGMMFALAINTSAATKRKDDPWNEYTIRTSDIPSDAPRFEDYPVKIYVGTNAAPKIAGNRESQMYQTRIKKWSKEKPNFAGHYILATWGCGTDCTHVTIIDAITGKVLHPPELSTNISTNVQTELFQPGHSIWYGEGSIKFRADSALLIVIGMPNEDPDLRGISYFVLRKGKLERVRFVPKPWYPEN